MPYKTKSCWKKVHSGKKVTRYAHVNRPQEIEVWTERIMGKSIPFVTLDVTGDSLQTKEFKDKKEANKFAKSWMKKHDDGCE